MTHDHAHWGRADCGPLFSFCMLLTGLDLLTNHTAHGGGPNAAAMMDNLVTAILAH